MKSYLFITAIMAALTGSLAASGCGLSDGKLGSANSALSSDDDNAVDGGVGSGGGSDTSGVIYGAGNDTDGGIGSGSGSDTSTRVDGDAGVGADTGLDAGEGGIVGTFLPSCISDADCDAGYVCVPNLANPGPCSPDGCAPPEGTCQAGPGLTGD